MTDIDTEGLKDWEKLRLLATWHDIQDAKNENVVKPEVQNDLRRIAQILEDDSLLNIPKFLERKPDESA